jgi:cobalt-zinc-cadmium efflux system membrane fusion protein
MYIHSKLFRTTTYIATFCILGLVVESCGRKADSSEEKDAKFEVTDSLLKSLLIDTVQQADALSQIVLSGKITPDDEKMVKIYPMVSGITQDVHVQLGDIVSKGQLLAIMRSAEVAGFSKDAIASEADLKNARRAAQVAEDLYKSGLESQKDLESAQADYQKALAENKRATAVMGINKSNANLGYELRAPIGGFVVEKNITDNMQIRDDNSQNLFTIADLSTVWAMVNIYESDIANIKPGDGVKVTTISYPDKEFDGKIDKIYDMLDPDNKVMRARVIIKNPGNILKPEMFAKIEVKAHSGLSLPVINTRALVFDNDRNYVLVVDGKAHVRIQPVVIAKKFEDKAYISSGLKAGERIIASRQVFMYESLKN